MGDKLTLALLAVWAVLFGLFSVTNIQVELGRPLMGFAALALGVVCAVRALQK